jgi:hypothetical protein
MLGVLTDGLFGRGMRDGDGRLDNKMFDTYH